LKVIAGLLVCRSGTVEFEGRCMNQLSVGERLNTGIVYMPQGNQVFRTLTVRDNLTVSLSRRSARYQRQEIERVVDVVPVVGKHLNRVAGTLSGGEKQQVALAIALMKRPRLLLCDEPSLGLAPNLLDEVFAAVAKASKDMMMSVLLVEHKVREAFEICGRVVALQRGAVVKRGSPNEFGDQVLRDVFLT
ncbi:MAG: ATP-binding cassette domain-containing protein, partial [Planctomycetes bacterium]|nr:ATP-binding cassette domain-containing protein [Planctomycetota bacterium]